MAKSVNTIKRLRVQEIATRIDYGTISKIIPGIGSKRILCPSFPARLIDIDDRAHGFGPKTITAGVYIPKKSNSFINKDTKVSLNFHIIKKRTEKSEILGLRPNETISFTGSIINAIPIEVSKIKEEFSLVNIHFNKFQIITDEKDRRRAPRFIPIVKEIFLTIIPDESSLLQSDEVIDFNQYGICCMHSRFQEDLISHGTVLNAKLTIPYIPLLNFGIEESEDIPIKCKIIDFVYFPEGIKISYEFENVNVKTHKKLVAYTNKNIEKENFIFREFFERLKELLKEKK